MMHNEAPFRHSASVIGGPICYEWKTKITKVKIILDTYHLRNCMAYLQWRAMGVLYVENKTARDCSKVASDITTSYLTVSRELPYDLDSQLGVRIISISILGTLQLWNWIRGHYFQLHRNPRCLRQAVFKVSPNAQVVFLFTASGEIDVYESKHTVASTKLV